VTRLKFLVDFCRAVGMSPNQLALKAGVTPNTLRYWLQQDDTCISNLEGFFDGLGARLKFSISSPDDPETFSSDDISAIIGNLRPVGRLDFFNSAITKYSPSKVKAAEKLGVTYQTLYFWLYPQNDDCNISYVYKFCEAYNLNLNIRIVPKS